MCIRDRNNTLNFVLDSTALKEEPINADDIGFVKFRIKQQADNASCTQIHNQAKIYLNGSAQGFPVEYEHHIHDGIVPLCQLPTCIIGVPPKTCNGIPTIQLSSSSIQNDLLLFSLNLTEPQPVTANIFDIMGRHQGMIFQDKIISSGQYTIEKPVVLSPGVYFLTLEIDGLLTTQKFVVMK